jgi:methionine-rich copper-binding protein CopC
MSSVAGRDAVAHQEQPRSGLVGTARDLAALVVVSVLLAFPPDALAHARLVRASPPGQAEVTAPPERIELWFSELLEDGFNSVEIVPAEPAGQPRPNLAQGAPAVDHRDRTHMVVPLSRLGPGHYAVEWRVLSRDGHSATGRYTFRIRGAR